MKITEKITVMAIGAMVILFSSSSYSSATTLSFSPVPATIYQNQNVAIDIMVSGLAADQDLSTFDFNVLYDPSVLFLTSFSLTDNLGVIDDVDVIDLSTGADPFSGIINLSEFSYLTDFSAQADSFRLATLNFTGNLLGSSDLRFDSVLLGDGFGESMSFLAETGKVNVVPEPTTMLLFGTGLAGLVGIRRKKQSV